MSTLEVDTIGLRMLAAHCESWACELAGSPELDAVGAPWQPTFVAVTEISSDVMTAAAALASRMQSTACKLALASVRYDDSDDSSGSIIDGVIGV